MLHGNLIPNYEKSIKLIIDELGLIEQWESRYVDSTCSSYKEKYYILPNKEYLDTHTYEEVKGMWEQIN